MAPSAIVLLLTCVFIFCVWIRGIRKAAPSWTIKGLFIFLVPTAIALSLGASGVLANFETFPPPFVFFFISLFILIFGIAYSPLGTLLARNLSFSALIGFQCFRIGAELLIYLAVQEGLAPIQMSVEGYNMDILPALTALPFALWIRKHPSRFWISTWNWLGTLTLGIVLVVAVLSLPVPLRVFMNEPANLWVTTVPYILLPCVLVVAALTGHLLVYRKIKYG